jgi:hypothetical protein
VAVTDGTDGLGMAVVARLLRVRLLPMMMHHVEVETLTQCDATLSDPLIVSSMSSEEYVYFTGTNTLH